MKFALILLLALPGLPAFPSDAPPQVDAALRSRVKDFYTLITEHKSRQAEALVAEDTKDYYYDSQKPDMESFAIEKITYSPSFKTAELTINAKMHMLFPGAGPQIVPIKFPSTWKLENGKWCWYIDKARLAKSPFGQFHAGPAGTGDAPKQVVTPAMLAAAVRPEQNQIALDITGKQTATLNFTNSLPGPVALRAPSNPAVKIEIANPQIASGKSTAVTLRCDPASGARPEKLTFTVEPTGQQIPIQIIYTVINK